MEQQSLQGACVFRDDRPEVDPSERYKLWTKFLPTQEEQEQGAKPGLWAMVSADGLRWEPLGGQPNPAEVICDTLNMFWFDESIGLYVGFPRVFETQHGGEAAENKQQLNAAGRGRYRSMGRITSPDFRTWSPMEIVLEADAIDLGLPVPSQRDDPRPNLDFYTTTAMKYPFAADAYVMMPSVFYHWEKEDFPATQDVQLLTSRDGRRWERAGNRAPFLRPGFQGTATVSADECSGSLMPTCSQFCQLS